jgi:hypothetical protein
MRTIIKVDIGRCHSCAGTTPSSICINLIYIVYVKISCQSKFLLQPLPLCLQPILQILNPILEFPHLVALLAEQLNLEDGELDDHLAGGLGEHLHLAPLEESF